MRVFALFMAAFAALIASIFGWVNNIILIVASGPITGMTLLRIVGIFLVPLGIVLGYIK